MTPLNSRLFISKPSCLPVVLLIVNCIFPAKSEASNVSQCATFFASETSFKTGLTLRDMTVIGSSEYEYSTQEKSWHTTGIWRVNSGCKLKSCDDAYLQGKCNSLEGSTDSSTEKWLSAKCDCVRQCSCEDVHLRRSICARVYHHSGGCNDCHASYTELEPGSVESFADDWSEAVDSVLVRPGCTLNIYEEEDFDGESLTLEGSNELQELDEPLGSYQCECSTYEPMKHKETPGENPTMMDIPESVDEIVKKLESNSNLRDHPGWKEAMKSVVNERSSRNTYIMMIGSSGAGKSSTINILLGQPNVTVAGDHQSTTSEIIELRIPVPIPELGIKNSELRIIDTPGLGDTRGVEKDAQFLATLDDYMGKHEELKRRIPNLVLVFHKFADNRFDGVSSSFVKMIRGLNTLRGKITDDNFSNVVFVFSHFCSGSKIERQNPSELLLKFRNVVEKYSLFPKPIMMAVVENKGKENSLPMVNGNFLLPNQEYFPLNLIQKLDAITRNSNDTVGNAMIRTVFMSIEGLPEDLLVEAVQHYMVPSIHNKVAQYLNSLNTNAFAVDSTEVSRLLHEAFNRMDASARVPDKLEYLQMYLNLRNIRSKKDVPQTTLAKLELLNDLPEEDNEFYYKLLKDGLGLTAPLFPQNVMTGYGYNSLTGSILPTTPFKLDELAMSSSGFMIPKVITCEKYAERDMSILKNATGTIRLSLTVKRFQLKLKHDSEASPDFLNKIDSLSAFDQHDYENVEGWNKFFNDYGTHVITSADIGGRIEIQITTSDLSAYELPTDTFREDLIAFFLWDALVLKLKGKEGKHSITFHGGNPAYHVTDVSKISLEELRVTMKNWMNSVNYYPAVFRDQMESMTKYFQRTWSSERWEKVNNALSLYIISNLKYIPPTTPTPDPKVVEEMERKKREQEEELKRVQEEMRKAKEAEEERKRQAELEMKRLQEEAKRKEEERRRQEEEAEKERQRRERERQAELRRIEKQRETERRAEEARREWERRQQAERERLEHERFLQMLAQPPQIVYRHRSSCLKSGTKILLADFSEKSVETLEIGDVLLDMNLKPTRVLGVSYEFLLDQKFYGFDNHTFFFTDTHLFVGTTQANPYQLYTASRERLFAQNPLLEYLNISRFDGNEEYKMLYFNGDKDVTPTSKPVQIFQDPNNYDEETLIYFIQVDSPSGTYIAEGFVSRHEVPPMEHWPNTMPILFPLLNSNGMRLLAKMPYEINAISFIDRISDKVKSAVLKVFQSEPDLWNHNNIYTDGNYSENCMKLGFDDYDLNEVVGKIFGNPMVAALGMEVYGRSGSIIAMCLDNPTLKINDCRIAHLQKSLLRAMEKEIDESLMTFNGWKR